MSTLQTTSCADFHRPAARFRFNAGPGSATKCLRHAISHPPLLRTAVATPAVVGTVLTAINQGNRLAAGELSADLWWKIPLTYCVPYCVATFSALRLALLRSEPGRPPA